MDLEFLHEQIKDELEDSKKYAKMAIELKPMTEPWSKKFFEMSNDEHKHASQLYSMFNEYYLKITEKYEEVPDYINDIKSDIIDTYAKCSSVIKEMWLIYK